MISTCLLSQKVVRQKGSQSSCPKSLLGTSLGDLSRRSLHSSQAAIGSHPSFPASFSRDKGDNGEVGSDGVLRARPQAGHRKKIVATGYKFERDWILTFDRLTDVISTFKIYGPNRRIDLHHLRFVGVFQLKRRPHWVYPRRTAGVGVASGIKGVPCFQENPWSQQT